MTKRWTVVLLVLPLLLGVAACGDDDDDDPEAWATADDAPDAGDAGKACQTYVDINAQFNGEPDPEVLGGLLDDLEANPPAEVADDLAVMIPAARTVLESGGEDFAPFETEEFGSAQTSADAYFYDACDADTKLEATAVDYAFTGLPEELDAGSVFIKMTNGSTQGESHELGVMRRADGVTASFDEILALSEDEAESKVEFVGGAFAESEGDVGVAFLDLEPGEYLAVCFIPVGGEDDGPPHFTKGMQHAFTVA